MGNSPGSGLADAGMRLIDNELYCLQSLVSKFLTAVNSHESDNSNALNPELVTFALDNLFLL